MERRALFDRYWFNERAMAVADVEDPTDIRDNDISIINTLAAMNRHFLSKAISDCIVR